jgi:integrase
MRKPFFIKRLRAWYVWSDGKQIRLGPDKQAAFQHYCELIAQPSEINRDAPVVALCDEFLDWCQQHRSARTYEWYRGNLQSFCAFIGRGVTIAQLQPYHVSNWLARHHKGRSPNTIRGGIRAVQRACNWAVRQGYLLRSPVAHMEKPAQVSREIVITDEQWAEITKDADAAWLDFLTILYETGCRPHEARIVESRHVDLLNRRWVFPVSESKGKRLPRVVYLNDVAFEIVKRRCQQHPAGPIFRNSRGIPWTRNAIRCRFRKHKSLASGLCATAIRHTWTTNAIRRGVDPVTAAILLGHSDPATLSRHYQHLSVDKNFLLAAATRATTPHDR